MNEYLHVDSIYSFTANAIISLDLTLRNRAIAADQDETPTRC